MDLAAIIIVSIIGVLILLLVWCTIFSKAGYGGWRGILMLIPIVNTINLLLFVCQKWPVQKKLEFYKAKARKIKET